MSYGSTELARIDHITVCRTAIWTMCSASAFGRQRHFACAKGPGGLTDLRPIHVHAFARDAGCLRQHIFNGVIWPEISHGCPARPTRSFTFHGLQVGQLILSGPGGAPDRLIRVRPPRTVPAVGYRRNLPRLVGFHRRHGPQPALWQALQGQRVAQLVIKTAFGADGGRASHRWPSVPSKPGGVAQLDGKSASTSPTRSRVRCPVNPGFGQPPVSRCVKGQRFSSSRLRFDWSGRSDAFRHHLIGVTKMSVVSDPMAM